MKWLKIFCRKSQCVIENEEIQRPELERADQDLEELRHKITEEQAKMPELARAVASARRVQYRVNRFTEEIDQSFRRLNHG